MAFEKKKSGGQIKVPDEVAIQIKTRRIAGESTTDLAREFGVGEAFVAGLATGRVRPHLEVQETPPHLPQGSCEHRIVPGWPDYAAGADGSLWHRWHGRWKMRAKCFDKDGYIIAAMKDHGRVRQAKIHRLILEAFIGPCPPGMEACHWNGIKSDNRLENLRWDTMKANRKDALRLGELPIGEENHFTKLKEKDVREMRQRYSGSRITYTQATTEAKRLGVSPGAILLAVRGKTWKWIA